MAVIETQALEKLYPGSVHALRGVDLAVEEGEIFGLLGPNGAGKTSLVRILATLSRPSGGTARVAGHDVVQDPAPVRQAIGYVAQGASVDGQLTGRENLLLQGRLFGLRGAALKTRVDELLDLLDLAEAGERLARGYSGGMQRRLDLALGLIHRPGVLFLDEPSAGLDPESRRAVWQEVERLAREERITVLLTTHYLEEADRLADRVAIIDRGRIVGAGAPAELKGRLEGDLVTVRLAAGSDGETARTRLAALTGVHEAILEDGRLHVRVGDGAKAVPQIVGALSGYDILDVTMSRPTLDDVYLALTGRSFEEVDGGEPDTAAARRVA